MNKFYLIELSNTSGIDLELLLDHPSFLTVAKKSYIENDWQNGILICIQWINENF